MESLIQTTARSADQGKASSNTRDVITLAHGSGGRAMQRLISEIITAEFKHVLPMNDYGMTECTQGNCVFSTDSFVITPRIFSGGDIGKLAVYGSCNDVAMSGAKASVLSCGLIIEEGFSITELKTVIKNMALAAKECGVEIKAGDTKVVPKGACDGLFINTTAIGFAQHTPYQFEKIQAGDVIIVSRDVGCHGASIANERFDLGITTDIKSDCANLYPLVESIAPFAESVRYLRDATRGGLTAVLNELADASAKQFDVVEQQIPVSPAVSGLCELLGLDPYYLANEGTLVCVVAAESAQDVLAAFHGTKQGEQACIIGCVVEGKAGRVTIESSLGVKRLLDMPEGELLPRIC